MLYLLPGAGLGAGVVRAWVLLLTVVFAPGAACSPLPRAYSPDMTQWTLDVSREVTWYEQSYTALPGSAGQQYTVYRLCMCVLHAGCDQGLAVCCDSIQHIQTS